MLESPQCYHGLMEKWRMGPTWIAALGSNPDQPHICSAEPRFFSKRFSYPQFFFSWLLRNSGSQNYRAARVSEVEAMRCEQMNISLNIFSGQSTSPALTV